jgi:hypothetical protein
LKKKHDLGVYFIIISYTGEILQEEVLQRALEDGPCSLDYTNLVSWLTHQLKDFCSLQESVNAITGKISASFTLCCHYIYEISSFNNKQIQIQSRP